MERIQTDVVTSLTLSRGEVVEIKQTAPNGTTREVEFPSDEAVTVALKILYQIFSNPRCRAALKRSQFYPEVKGLFTD